MTLDVVDDGQGFSPEQVTASTRGGGFGLVAMRSRVTELGGTLVVESEPGAGTAVVARFPLADGTGPGDGPARSGFDDEGSGP